MNAERRRCGTCQEGYWVRFGVGRDGHLLERRDPCACTRPQPRRPSPAEAKEIQDRFQAAQQTAPETPSTPDEPIQEKPKMTAHAATPDQQKEIREIADEILTRDPEVRPATLRIVVKERLGIELNSGQAHYYLSKARSQAPTSRPVAASVVPGPRTTAGAERVNLGETEIRLLRYVGVAEEQIAEAARLANLINDVIGA